MRAFSTLTSAFFVSCHASAEHSNARLFPVPVGDSMSAFCDLVSAVRMRDMVIFCGTCGVRPAGKCTTHPAMGAPAPRVFSRNSRSTKFRPRFGCAHSSYCRSCAAPLALRLDNSEGCAPPSVPNASRASLSGRHVSRASCGKDAFERVGSTHFAGSGSEPEASGTGNASSVCGDGEICAPSDSPPSNCASTGRKKSVMPIAPGDRPLHAR